MALEGRQVPVPADVQADGIERYPQDVEAAIYFCCLEALQNVTKYASASTVGIRLTSAEGMVSCKISDNGQGFDMAATARGSGLQNMADRMEALGGSVEVESSVGRGTSVTASVPLQLFELAS